jgi:hypothetical protein
MVYFCWIGFVLSSAAFTARTKHLQANCDEPVQNAYSRCQASPEVLRAADLIAVRQF